MFGNGACLETPKTGDAADAIAGRIGSVNADGAGYTLQDGGQFFLYTAGSGQVMAVSRRADSSLYISTRQRQLAAPVENVNIYSWLFYEDTGRMAGLVWAAWDTNYAFAQLGKIPKNYFERTNKTQNETDTTRPNDLHKYAEVDLNRPDNGLMKRFGEPSPYPDWPTLFYTMVELPLKGMGITVSLNLDDKRFQLSVRTPR